LKVGDLVKITASGLRPQIDGIALITRVEERKDSSGAIVQYWAQMAESGHLYWFRAEHIEVISESL